MTLRTLNRRSLWFHRRSHLGVWLGALVGSAALIGALVVGESVRDSLRARALARLGAVQVALDSGNRLFGADLGNRFEQTLPPASNHERAFAWYGPAAPTFHLKGTASKQDGTARANSVQIYGVTRDFWSLSPQSDLVSASIQQSLPLFVTAGQRPQTPAAVHALATNFLRFVESPSPGQIMINRALADQLQVGPGDTIVLRFSKPTAFSEDAALSPRHESAAGLRAVVEDIVDAAHFGNFSLKVGQRPPLNAFMNLNDLWRLSGTTNKANLTLVAGAEFRRDGNFPSSGWRGQVLRWIIENRALIPKPILKEILRPFSSRTSPAPSATTTQYLESQLQKRWRLSDVGIQVHTIQQPVPATGGETVAPMIEISTPRIFLDPVVGKAALKPRTTFVTNSSVVIYDRPEDLAAASYVTNGIPLITYLANAIRFGDKLTPYSMVTATGPPWTPTGMADDEIIVNEWLARDLGLKPGDHVELNYFDPESGSRLVERTNTFRVRAIVPMRGIYADRTLMPEFPGVAEAESTGDWDTGFPLVHKIRNQDEAYWKQYRGTPKAFVTLNAGRKMWANRFGDYTAIRYPVPTNGFASAFQRIVEANLIANLDPSQLGLAFQPVREQALKAANESQDFGGLFIGFSFFLIVAALLLMAMLFTFGVEQRAEEIGTFLALGFPLKQVRRMFLREGIAIAALGAIVGTVAGVYYAKGMLWGLTTIWRSAVGTSALELHYSLGTLAGGALGSVAVSAVAIWLTIRKQGRQPVRALLAGGGEAWEYWAPVQAMSAAPRRKRSRGWWVGIIAGALGLATVGFALAEGEAATADTFFSAGSLILISGLGFMASALVRLGRTSRADTLTLQHLGLRACARRRNRSLAVAGMLACGSFLILSIGVFRLDANRDATKRSSGTGGFAFIGETSLPVLKDLNTPAGRAAYGLDEHDLAGVSFVPFRVHEGDEASCLNLNRAQQPRLLGVNPELLAERGAFTFAKLAKGLTVTNGWEALNTHVGSESAPSENEETNSGTGATPVPGEVIPAIGDAASIQWAMHKQIGDTIDYMDERGQRFKVKIVGAVANSILQGQLIIDEAAFVRHFPSTSGYQFYLVDAPPQNAQHVSAVLTRALTDLGLELTPAATRLAEFNAVQNTYLNTFQVLGGLGLLLGSVGLGVVVLRNVLERRGELALLLAVGFTRRLLGRMVLAEHFMLLAAGLGIGLVAAVVAVLPALLSPGTALPLGSLALLLTSVLLNGLLWTWLATRWALRGRLLDALRNE